MEKKLIIIFITNLLIVFLLAGCTLSNDDQSVARASFEEFMYNVNNNDSEAIRKMFSKNAADSVEDLDKKIIELIEFSKGEIISYDDWGGPAAYESVENDRKTQEITSTFDITTSKGKFRMAIKEVIKDTTNTENIGIVSIYVTSTEKTDEDFAYWGDGKWTHGITLYD